jgi:hypothetical protein
MVPSPRDPADLPAEGARRAFGVARFCLDGVGNFARSHQRILVKGTGPLARVIRPLLIDPVLEDPICSPREKERP